MSSFPRVKKPKQTSTADVSGRAPISLGLCFDPRDVDRRPALGSWGPHWGHPWWFSHSLTSCLGWVVGEGRPRLF